MRLVESSFLHRALLVTFLAAVTVGLGGCLWHDNGPYGRGGWGPGPSPYNHDNRDEHNYYDNDQGRHNDWDHDHGDHDDDNDHHDGYRH